MDGCEICFLRRHHSGSKPLAKSFPLDGRNPFTPSEIPWFLIRFPNVNIDKRYCQTWIQSGAKWNRPPTVWMLLVTP